MILRWITLGFIITLTVQFVIGEVPKFRILAPEFICPKDEDTPIEKPDNTIITLQTAAGSDFDIAWTVRWTPILRPTQRFTLMLWKTVRALEAKLNAPQPEPYVFVIANDELLHGVNYVFSLAAVEPDGEISSPKTFHIDNTQGDQKLDMVEGRADLMYVVLVGAQVTYADVDFELEALVTSCFPTQDYHFIWTVHNTQTHDVVYMSPVNGSRLVIPAYSLESGHEYDAICQVYKHSTGFQITKTGLPFQVWQRGLEVYLSVEYLMVPVKQAFFIEPKVFNHDYSDSPVLFNWECTFAGTPCNFLESVDNDTLYFTDGLPELGEYKIKLSVNVMDQLAEASSVIKTVEHTLPVIQITPMSRILNEGSKVPLVANASNVAPTCTLTWYFATENYICFNNDTRSNSTFEDCQHGEALSDTLTIFSLEENFLTELADFTNETEWRQVSGEMIAGAGRARFVAECGCSITFECETKGMVYADMSFILNESPKPDRVKLTPETGTAMETIFRISTLAVIDKNTPLRYSFYSRVGDDDALLLGSFVDHLALETLLPYVDGGGTNVWVEICDSLGACASGEPTTVVLNAGDGSTIDVLIANALGHIRRCELHHLMTNVGAAVITYTNSNQSQLLSKFTAALLEALPPDTTCIHNRPEQYNSFLHWLAIHGIDTGVLTQ